MVCADLVGVIDLKMPVRKESTSAVKGRPRKRRFPLRQPGIDARCFRDRELICFNCKRQNHSRSKRIQFNMLQRENLNTRRPYCLFRAADVRSGRFAFCEECYDYLQVDGLIKPHNWSYIWPAYLWKMMCVENGRFARSAWGLIPSNWRGWWIGALLTRFSGCGVSLTDPPVRVRDVTDELQRRRDILQELKIGDLLRKWETMIPDVLCPWGCTEYIEDAGTIAFDAMVQRCYSAYELPMSSKKRQFDRCISARHDFFWSGNCYLHGNSEWNIQPSIAITSDRGLRILTCRHCDDGNIKRFLHLPRLPQILPTRNGNQLAHAVLQPRQLRVIKAGKHNVTYQMAQQESCFSGVDTCFVGSHGRFDLLSHIGTITEALSITGRSDIRHLLDRLEEDGILDSTAVESYKLHAKEMFGKPEEFDSKKYGGTYVSYEDCIRLQDHMDDSKTIAIKNAFGQMESVWVKWPTHIVFVHEHTNYGAWFPCIPAKMYKDLHDGERTVRTDLLILAVSLICLIPELWELLSESTMHGDDWSGFMLTYATGQMFQDVAVTTSKAAHNDPFHSAYSWTELRALEFIYERLGRNRNEMILFAPNLANEFLRYVNDFLCQRLSRSSILDIHFYDDRDHDVLHYNAGADFIALINRCPARASDLVDEYITVNEKRFELRYIFLARGVGGASKPLIFVRHGKQFRSWWTQRLGRLYSIQDGQVNIESWSCVVYVVEMQPDYKKLRSQLLESFGGQTKVSCSNHRLPMIVQQGESYWEDRSRLRSVDPVICSMTRCTNHALYICPQNKCSAGLCKKCTESFNSDSMSVILVTPHAVARKISRLHQDNDDDESSTNSCFEIDPDSDSDEFDDLPTNQQNSHSFIMQSSESDEDNEITRMPGTIVGEQNPLDIQMNSAMAHIGMHSILNHAGSMLMRHNRELKPSRIEQQFLQKIIVGSPGETVPLVTLDPMLFPDLCPFDNNYDGSIIGGIPTALFSGVTQAKRYNIGDIHAHARIRMTCPFSTSSTQIRSMFFYYDAISNEKLSTTDSRIIKHRGIFSTGMVGGLRATQQIDRVFTECMDNHAMVNCLCALQRYQPDNLFITFTPNQAMTPGLKSVMDWLQSQEILDNYPYYESRHQNEIRAAFADALAPLFNRNWDKMMKELIDYIVFSTEQPIGKVQSYFARKEWQGEQGNLDHWHMLFCIGVRTEDASTDLLENLRAMIRGTQIDILSPDEIDDFEQRGIFKNSSEWMVIQDLAGSILTHKGGHQKRHERRVGVRDDDLKDRVQEAFHIKQSTTEHVSVSINVRHSDEAWKILCDLGMAKRIRNDPVRDFEIVHPLLKAVRHYAPRRLTDDNMSPVHPLFFSILRSMQNIQHVSGHSVNAYVCGYVANMDDNVKVYLNAKAMNPKAITVTTEFQYNSKLQSSEYFNRKREARKNRRLHTSSRSITRHQVMGHILGLGEVKTNRVSEPIPTTFYESRAGLRRGIPTNQEKHKEAQANADAVHWYRRQENRDSISVLIYPDYERLHKKLPRWRQFTLNQVLMMEGDLYSCVTTDRVTVFSIRPPELRFVSHIQSYFRFFYRDKVVLNAKEYKDALHEDLEQSLWLDGSGRQLLLRDEAICELRQYVNESVTAQFPIPDEMVNLLAKLFTFETNAQEDEEDLIFFVSDEEQQELRENFIYSCGNEILPIPVVTSLKPTDAAQFTYHILLSMGSYSTELDVLSHRNLREAYVAASLFSDSDAEEEISLLRLLNRYVIEQLAYQPINSQLFDEYLAAALRAFRALLIEETLPLFSLPSCLSTKLHIDCSIEIRNRINTLKRDILLTTIERLSEMLMPLLGYLPTPEQITDERIVAKLRGPMPRGTYQSQKSYAEQEELRLLIRNIIHSYRDPNRTTQAGKLVIVGAPGTGKTFCEFYAILYLYALGLFAVPTSFQGETASAAGGIHDTKMYHLPVHQDRGQTPFRDAEKALFALARDPFAIQLHLEMDCEIKEEGEMLNAATWAAEDIIQRAICDSNDYKADKMLFTTMDHRQIKPCEGGSFFLSPVVLSTCTIYRLNHFVRSARDPDLQRFIEIQRMKASLLQPNKEQFVREFQNIFNRNAVIVPSWDDPLITETTIRIVPKRQSVKKLEREFLTRKKKEIGRDKYRIVHSVDNMKAIRSKASWKPANAHVSDYLDQHVKEPRLLTLYEKGLYQITFNDTRTNKFTQSRLAVLLKLPSLDHNQLRTFNAIEIWMAPPGFKSSPTLIDRTEEKLTSLKWKKITIGRCPGYARTDSVNGMMAKRIQYGLRHFICTTIHMVIGATFDRAAIGISRTDPDFRVWEKGMIQVASSRCHHFSETIWVGKRDDILGMLVDTLLKYDPQEEYIDNVIDRLSVNREDVARYSNRGHDSPFLHTLAIRNHPYNLEKQQLPTDNTGFVYILISLRTRANLYIGETSHLLRRLAQHNSGHGAKQTRDLRYRPWAILAYVTGFQGNKRERKHFEARWQYYAKLCRRRGDKSIHSAVVSSVHAIGEFPTFDLRLIEYASTTASYDDFVLREQMIDNKII